MSSANFCGGRQPERGKPAKPSAAPISPVNENQYQSLCEACDRVLVESGPTLERMAITWLHVLSEHPVVLRDYTGIFDQSPRGTMLRMKSVLSRIRGLLPGAGIFGMGEPQLERAEVMFVSHLLNETQIGGREDFYFGLLPEDLRHHGLSCCVVLINHAGARTRRCAEWAYELARRSILARRLSVRQELTLSRRQAQEGRRLRDAGARSSDGVQRRVYAEAARRAMSGPTLDARRIHEQLRAHLARVRPRVVVATFEGHAWERLLFAAAREQAPGTICVGYHHTIVFPRQHAAFRLLGPPYDPDVILTAGDVARDRFSRAFASQDIRVATLGTHRHPGRGMALVPDQPPSEQRRSCLVLPDGILSEVLYLFDFAIAAARLAPRLQFILRLHPLISRRLLRQQYSRFRRLPPNVELSEQTLAGDCRRSRWALYRGSGAAVQAVIAGVQPLYVDQPGELSIDCLSDLHVWKRVVSAPDEFVKIAVSEAEEDAATSLREAIAAAAYCGRYFMPVDSRVLVDLAAPTRTSRE